MTRIDELTQAIDLRDIPADELAEMIRDRLAVNGASSFVCATEPPQRVANDRYHVEQCGEEEFVYRGEPVRMPGGGWHITYHRMRAR